MSDENCETAPRANAIDVRIDLGSIEPTAEQVARLKAYVTNQLLTWVTADLQDEAPPLITCHEIDIPGSPEPPPPPPPPDTKGSGS